MPDVVLAVLVLTVVPYLVLMGGASVAFLGIRRQDKPPDPSEWPRVSVVVPVPPGSAEDFPQSLLDCSYPEDRVEIIPVHEPSSDAPAALDDPRVPIRPVQLEEPPARKDLLHASLRKARPTARGEVLLITRAERAVPSTWIQSMVRQCTPDTPLVVGPTVVEHEDLFLPRLEAFFRVGGIALAAGLQSLGVPPPWPASNFAIKRDIFDDASLETEDPTPAQPLLTNGRAVFNPEAEAVVAEPSVSSFGEYVRHLTRAVRWAVWEASWKIQLLAVGLWLTHLILLVCCLAAVALPAWRQPTLLALLGKMGADALLSVPAARYYGEGGLTRSIVPTELLLLIALPIAGFWALIGLFSTPGS